MKIGSESWHQLIRQAADTLGVEVDRKASDKFEAHAAELLAWNRKVNLTAITDPREIAIKHFVDSLAPLPLLPPGCRLLDIGSGAGFPGIPLKIVMPALQVTLIDAARKRAHFMRHIIRVLQLKGITALHQRTDDFLRDTQAAHAFDVIVSRAFTSLERFFHAAEPFLAEGGRIIAFKGKLAPGELESFDAIREQKKAASGNGPTAFQWEVVSYRLPFSGDQRNLVILRQGFG
jgi:16S rRNA (guanine527-N7)-methyltransferase